MYRLTRFKYKREKKINWKILIANQNDFLKPSIIKIWDFETSKWIKDLEGHDQRVTSVSFY